jgi:hypothetical protein
MGGNEFPLPSQAQASNFTSYASQFTVYNYTALAKRNFIYWATGNTSAGYQIWNNGQGFYNETATAITRLDYLRSGSQTITGTLQLWGEK